MRTKTWGDHSVQFLSTSSKLFLSILLIVTALVGCESKPAVPGAHLAGAVTIAGQAVEEGSIVFTPVGGARGRAVGVKVNAGHYDCPYVPLGQSLVQIYALRPTGKMVEVMGTMKPEMEDLVPKKYRDGITIDIQGDNTKQDFSL
jgi:hypothetical protein